MSNDTPSTSARQPLPPMLQAGENKPRVLTMETIQELLDENATMIKAIVDCQNTGKLDSCAKYELDVINQTLLHVIAPTQVSKDTG